MKKKKIQNYSWPSLLFHFLNFFLFQIRWFCCSISLLPMKVFTTLSPTRKRFGTTRSWEKEHSTFLRGKNEKTHIKKNINLNIFKTMLLLFNVLMKLHDKMFNIVKCSKQFVFNKNRSPRIALQESLSFKNYFCYSVLLKTCCLNFIV